MIDWFKQFICKHKNTTKIAEVFEENPKDAFYGSNTGCTTLNYAYDILKCDHCKKEIKRYHRDTN